MPTITINITLPSPSLSRRKVVLLAIGFLAGLMVSGIVVDCLREGSILKGAYTRTFGDVGALGNSQKKKFEAYWATPEASLKTPVEVKGFFIATCLTCARNAEDISKIMNTVSSTRVVSMNSVMEKEPKQGIVIQSNGASQEEIDGLRVLEGAFKASGIPYKTETFKDKEEKGISIFFGE